eukprot:GEZU01015108.1.p1 GENE.GEZU01015108.1~~GEZU01015108.1.p1  ORF type:complete len:250 (-),score=50.12 GEZU01015108.1:293-1042(-)
MRPHSRSSLSSSMANLNISSSFSLNDVSSLDESTMSMNTSRSYAINSINGTNTGMNESSVVCHTTPTLTSEFDECEIQWQEIQAVVSLLEPGHSVDTLISSAEAVLTALENNIQLSEKRKRLILQRVSRLMDSKDAELLLKLTSIIFKLSPVGTFLLSTTRLLYHLSKKEENDKLFSHERIIEPLLRVIADGSAVSSWDILFFSVGTLKNISQDSNNAKILAQKGAINSLAKLVHETMKVSQVPFPPVI